MGKFKLFEMYDPMYVRRFVKEVEQHKKERGVLNRTQLREYKKLRRKGKGHTYALKKVM